MAGRIEEGFDELPALVNMQMPLLHLFRNVIPAPFSSFSWRHYSTEHVRRRVRTVDPVPENPFVSLISMLTCEEGATVYSRRRASCRRWQSVMAYLFCLILLEPPQDEHPGVATQTHHTFFLAFLVSTSVFLAAQNLTTRLLFGELIAEGHKRAPMGIELPSIPIAIGSAAILTLLSIAVNTTKNPVACSLVSLYVCICLVTEMNILGADRLEYTEGAFSAQRYRINWKGYQKYEDYGKNLGKLRAKPS